MGWTAVLCTCNGTLRWDARSIGRALSLAEAPILFDRLPRDEIHRFMDRVSAAAVDRLLVACCGAEDLLRQAAQAAGADPARLVVANARETCFWPHPDADSANAKAARLLRARMRLAEITAPPPEVRVRVGPTVLIVADSPAGLQLARRLGAVARPVLLLDERSAAFDAEAIHPLPWKASWGRLRRVEGALGQFRITVSRTQPLDLQTCVHCRRCVPVCHTAAISEGLRLRLDLCDRCGDCLQACADVGAIRIPREETDTLAADQVVVLAADGVADAPPRTGYHLLRDPDRADVEALAWKVHGLIGEFQKPQYVRYDAETCAGGAAGRPACGRCITACPYHAIARSPRNPLRVEVDVQACEGCGACVAACPTSSLTFTDPPPGELYERLRALLAPLPGGPGERLVVAFHCPEKGTDALAEAGRLRWPYPGSVLPVPVACLRQVSEATILAAFRLGAAGVALFGCEACPHGERALLLDRLALARTVLEAFGLGPERVQLVVGAPRAMVQTLERFAGSVGPPPVTRDGREGLPTTGNREVVADAIGAFIATTGREPGRVALPAEAPFAFPEVRASGCTLCRTCVNVCPTHAFRFQEASQTLELKAVACVNCGLCAGACPEGVITLRPEMHLDRRGLDYQVAARDEPLRCLKCNTPFGNRRAIEAIEAKVLGMENLLDTFAGDRGRLLRLCPTCRAVTAMLEMEKGWEP